MNLVTGYLNPVNKTYMWLSSTQFRSLFPAGNTNGVYTAFEDITARKYNRGNRLRFLFPGDKLLMRPSTMNDAHINRASGGSQTR